MSGSFGLCGKHETLLNTYETNLKISLIFSPKAVKFGFQSRGKLVVDLDHDVVIVVLDVSEEMDKWRVSGAHRNNFHLLRMKSNFKLQ